MSITDFCPNCNRCHGGSCDHLSAQRSWANPIRTQVNGVPTELSILIAQLADLKRTDRKSTRLNSSHLRLSRMPSSA